MFRRRVLEGGRKQEEYRNLLRKLSKDNPGWSPKQLSLGAMRALGYTNTREERVLYIEWIEHKKSGQESSRRSINLGKIKDFEEALKILPDTCDPSDAIQWIQAHPAMSRKGRSEDKDSLIKLTPEDVLCPPHGKAPSRYAATSLQSWVNDPQSFFKMILTEHKRSSAQEEKKDAVVEKTVEEINSLLETLETVVKNE